MHISLDKSYAFGRLFNLMRCTSHSHFAFYHLHSLCLSYWNAIVLHEVFSHFFKSQNSHYHWAMILFSLLYITVLFPYKCVFVWINTMWNRLKDLFHIFNQLIYQSKIHVMHFQFFYTHGNGNSEYKCIFLSQKDWYTTSQKFGHTFWLFNMNILHILE